MDQCHSHRFSGIGFVGVFGAEERDHLRLGWFEEGDHSEGEGFVWVGVFDNPDGLLEF
jgi:hypothetical protein